MLIVRCAWCKKILGFKKGGDGESHGICKKCRKEQDKLIEELKR